MFCNCTIWPFKYHQIILQHICYNFTSLEKYVLLIFLSVIKISNRLYFFSGLTNIFQFQTECKQWKFLKIERSCCRKTNWHKEWCKNNKCRKHHSHRIRKWYKKGKVLLSLCTLLRPFLMSSIVGEHFGLQMHVTCCFCLFVCLFVVCLFVCLFVCFKNMQATCVCLSKILCRPIRFSVLYRAMTNLLDLYHVNLSKIVSNW